SRSDFIAKNMSTFEWLDVFHDLFRRSLGIITESNQHPCGQGQVLSITMRNQRSCFGENRQEKIPPRRGNDEQF
ncbi:MAG: hypothetical protein ABW134_20520, partial [Candidatus Thiodiazotropha endolucinida]